MCVGELIRMVRDSWEERASIFQFGSRPIFLLQFLAIFPPFPFFSGVAQWYSLLSQTIIKNHSKRAVGC